MPNIHDHPQMSRLAPLSRFALHYTSSQKCIGRSPQEISTWPTFGNILNNLKALAPYLPDYLCNSTFLVPCLRTNGHDAFAHDMRLIISYLTLSWANTCCDLLDCNESLTYSNSSFAILCYGPVETNVYQCLYSIG